MHFIISSLYYTTSRLRLGSNTSKSVHGHNFITGAECDYTIKYIIIINNSMGRNIQVYKCFQWFLCVYVFTCSVTSTFLPLCLMDCNREYENQDHSHATLSVYKTSPPVRYCLCPLFCSFCIFNLTWHCLLTSVIYGLDICLG